MRRYVRPHGTSKVSFSKWPRPVLTEIEKIFPNALDRYANGQAKASIPGTLAAEPGPDLLPTVGSIERLDPRFDELVPPAERATVSWVGVAGPPSLRVRIIAVCRLLAVAVSVVTVVTWLKFWPPSVLLATSSRLPVPVVL